MSNVTVDYDEILNRVSGQFLACRNANAEFSELTFVVENERQFVIEKEMTPNTIYVVLHYGESSVNFGQLILPVDFRILSEKNKMELVQRFLLAYTALYNQKRSGTVAQYYSTPVVDNALTEVKGGYRATFTFSGAFLIGTSASDYVQELDYEGTPIDFIEYREGYRNDTRPQPTPEGGGFACSVSGYATHTFTITTYLTSSDFCKKLNAQRYSDNTEDTTYTFTLKLYSGEGFKNRKYKCVSMEVSQKIGDTTMLTASFTL